VQLYHALDGRLVLSGARALTGSPPKFRSTSDAVEVPRLDTGTRRASCAHLSQIDNDHFETLSDERWHAAC
jgi:hypothetical protein